MLVGDSLILNQKESLVCLLHAAAPNSKIIVGGNDLYTNTTIEVNELARTINFH